MRKEERKMRNGGMHPECLCGKKFRSLGQMIDHVCEVDERKRGEGEDDDTGAGSTPTLGREIDGLQGQSVDVVPQ